MILADDLVEIGSGDGEALAAIGQDHLDGGLDVDRKADRERRILAGPRIAHREQLGAGGRGLELELPRVQIQVVAPVHVRLAGDVDLEGVVLRLVAPLDRLGLEPRQGIGQGLFLPADQVVLR